MESLLAPESAILDGVDLRIIQALQVSPRAPFSRIAEVVGVSEQTVARRYRRLRGEGILRVLGSVDPRRIGSNDWIVRVQCRPGSSARLAEVLARRDDVAWVTLCAAGLEISLIVRSRSQEKRDELLMQRLPNTAPVLAVSAHAVLHRFAGQGPDWMPFGRFLTDDQIAWLVKSSGPLVQREIPLTEGQFSGLGFAAPSSGALVVLEPADEPMLDVLARDGRAGYAELAAATGWTESKAARRLETLCRAGAVYFDVDLASEMLGFNTTGYLWLTVEPARLAEAGRALAGNDEISFVAAVSGPASLVACVICRDIEALYQYVSTRVGVLPGVRQVEISLFLRRIKKAGSLMNGLRLADPPRRSPARA